MLQTVITEGEFTAAASQTEEWSTARDFLALVANGCRTEVVFITEGCVNFKTCKTDMLHRMQQQACAHAWAVS
jgi:hypothetical protein